MSRLEKIRTLLQSELEARLVHSDARRAELSVDKVIGDGVDASISETTATNKMGAHDRDYARIRAIEAALERIEDGDYEECEECGEDIGLRRLEALPTAVLCVECQSELEVAEKRSRTRAGMLEDW